MAQGGCHVSSEHCNAFHSRSPCATGATTTHKCDNVSKVASNDCVSKRRVNPVSRSLSVAVNAIGVGGVMDEIEEMLRAAEAAEAKARATQPTHSSPCTYSCKV